MNTYIFTESVNFKTFLKENYPIVWSDNIIFTEKILNMDLNMRLTALMEFAYIRHS